MTTNDADERAAIIADMRDRAATLIEHLLDEDAAAWIAHVDYRLSQDHLRGPAVLDLWELLRDD